MSDGVLLATWNVNSIRAREDHVARWLRAAEPDLLAIQELKVENDAFRDQVLFSGPEHDALERLLDWGFVDLFRLHHDDPGFYSWWDYRQGAFRRNLGARIDLILATRPLAQKAVSSKIDAEPRKWSRPSDHTPVTARMLIS